MNEKMFTAALERGDTRMRAAAMLAAPKYGDKYVSELVERVGDDDLLVCQCARHSLCVLSNTHLGGKQFVDFGPLPNDHGAAKNTASIMWKVWFEDAKSNPKPKQEPASKSPDKTQNKKK